MDNQTIIDGILKELHTGNCKVNKISLIADEITLRDRLNVDIAAGTRTADIIDRSISRMSMYHDLDTIKIDTSNKTVREIVDEIMML